MADIRGQKPNRLTVDQMAARIEEDLASLYSAFMEKLLKAESGKASTVIEEYIGDRFDVRARWFLSAIHKERHVEPFLATLGWVRENDVEALIEHFASSLTHRELVDARIVGRISYWKSEAMRRVRKKALQQGVRIVASPDATSGISNLASSKDALSEAAPMTVEHPDNEATSLGLREANAPVSGSSEIAGQESVSVGSAKSSVPDLVQVDESAPPQDPATEDLSDRPLPDESADQPPPQSASDAVPKADITGCALDDAFEDRLSRFMRGHPGTTLADVKYSARVHTPEFQDWRRGKLKPDSVMTKRIEDVLSEATPLEKKPHKRRSG